MDICKWADIYVYQPITAGEPLQLHQIATTGKRPLMDRLLTASYMVGEHEDDDDDMDYDEDNEDL